VHKQCSCFRYCGGYSRSSADQSLCCCSYYSSTPHNVNIVTLYAMDLHTTDTMCSTTSPPNLPPSPTTTAEQPTNMTPRNCLAPEPSTIIVTWHGVGSICPSRWSMLPDRWSIVNNDYIANLKAMITDAFAFRAVVDDHAPHPDRATHTQAAATALRSLLMNTLFCTLHSDIFRKDVKQSPRARVTDWQHKRQSELGRSPCYSASAR
jgi:hypothetical protein